jgi:uncharacterized BrkB/YihY/UPF0761 family membrane protein
MAMGGKSIWALLKDTVLAFIEDEALSRGAAIAFYTVTSIAPILLIVIAIAGVAFGREAAQGALTAQIGGLAASLRHGRINRIGYPALTAVASATRPR